MTTVQATSQNTTVVQTNGVEVGAIEAGTVQVKEFGKTVNIPGNIVGKTNFFIDQSREYVGDHSLTRYVYLVHMHTVYGVIFLVSFIAPVFYGFAFAMAGVNVLFLFFFIQHMYVNVKTMPYVLKQPSVPDNMMDQSNTFLEITVEKFSAQYAAAKDAGIGLFVHGKGTVKLQIFQNKTMAMMRRCVVITTLCLIGSIFMVVYCIVAGIVRISLASSE